MSQWFTNSPCTKWFSSNLPSLQHTCLGNLGKTFYDTTVLGPLTQLLVQISAKQSVVNIVTLTILLYMTSAKEIQCIYQHWMMLHCQRERTTELQFWFSASKNVLVQKSMIIIFWLTNKINTELMKLKYYSFLLAICTNIQLIHESAETKIQTST